MQCMLASKVSMTQFFDEEGNAHAATVLDAGPITVTAIRSSAKDGYEAVQVGFGTRRDKNIAKAQASQWGEGKGFSHVCEFRLDAPTELALGTTLKAGEVLTAGDTVAVSGISKGKGFQGVVKRYNFKGGRRSHGQKHSERERGSSGATGPGRVFKGTRMAGRMGSDRVTVKNLTILAIDDATNTVLVRGAVPGRRGTIVEIVKTS